MPFSPTLEQLSIIDATAQQPNSLMVSAYAGTAKTTTLQLSAPGIKVPALALAFNKKIASELGPKLPGNFVTKTLNGLGHGAWMRQLPSTTVKIDDRKLGRLVGQIAKDNQTFISSQQWDWIKELCKAAMLSGISPGNEGQPLLQDTIENWKSLTDIPQDEFELCYDLAYQALKESIRLAKLGQISFDDQIYCPTILGGRWPQFPVVFIDESQDLSPLNHRMLQLCSRADGRIIAVGDSRQAIYAFRGADASSMETMRSLSSQWTDLNLTLTFRCPKAIVERQQQHAPGYRAWDGCQDGFVANNFQRPKDHEWSHNEEALDWWSFQDLTQHSQGSVAVLCRNNAPLLSFAFKLLRRNIGCYMLGRDIGRGLSNITKKISSDDFLRIIPFTVKMNEFFLSQISLAQANDQLDKAERLQDQLDSLQAIIEGSQAPTVGDLREAIENLFRQKDGLLTLSTIHRAKGLEWDLVVHLDPWRIPSKRALRDPIQLQQEKNLLYVCETRTKHTLLNLNLENFR